MTVEQCPCGSGASFTECCEPLIKGIRPAATAESLMRSRYSAYVKAEIDYLYDSTHPDYRKGYDHEGTREWAEKSQWKGLEIVAARGGEADTLGEVEFIATYSDGETVHNHHELGKFRKVDNRWLFVDGKMVTAKPIVSTKIGRNEPCPCGSGSKYKKCCGK
jgi:SEC-C motif-containing protein